jgi:SAM-dependent methyltransferase
MGISVSNADSLDVTNRFVLDFAARHGGRVLDYGCGSGRTVRAGRERGLEIYGTDVFYGGSQSRAEAAASGLLGDVIREMQDGRIPFPVGSFDLVMNNQVMEHVEDLDAVLREIHRVLRPGGTVLSVFPSVDVWREGHIGIPFSHWFKKRSRIRFFYTWALRKAGMGTWKEQAPTAQQWTIDKLDWIDRWTRYRTRGEIFESYGRLFSNELRETDYIRYRLLDRRSRMRELLVRMMDSREFAALASRIFRKLAFLVIVSEKR